MTRSTMMKQVCYDHCHVRGAFFMATEEGGECWCSRDQHLDYDSFDEGVCDLSCTGDGVSSFSSSSSFVSGQSVSVSHATLTSRLLNRQKFSQN